MSGAYPPGPEHTPNWVAGYVPSAAEWNMWWSNKVDFDDPKLDNGPWLPLAGGTMLGTLTLEADPTQPLEAATKAYVDQFTPVTGPFLPMSGGTMTGVLTLALDPVGALDAVTKEYADAIKQIANNAMTYGQNALPTTGGTMTGPLILGGDPVNPMAAATKQYVDRFLPLAGGSVSGSINVAGNIDVNAIYVHSAILVNQYNNWEWQLTVDNNTGTKYQTYRSGWSDSWNGTNGTRTWASPGGGLMSLDGSGNLYAIGNINGGQTVSGGNLSTSGTTTTGDFHTNTGTSYGVFNINGDSTIGGTLHCQAINGTSGSFSGNVNVSGTMIAAGVVSGGNGVIYPSFHATNAFAFAQQPGYVYGYTNGSASGSLVPPSTIRVKRDVTPSIVDCLDVIQRIKLHQFSYLNDETVKPVGYLVEELNEILPGSVGMDDQGKPFVADVNVLIALLMGAVHQLAEHVSPGMRA